MSDDYRNFILNASSREIIDQLNLEIKDPLVSAQNLINVLHLTLNPSPAMQRKLDSGDIDPAAIVEQITQNVTRALDVLDFYRETLDDG